MKKDDIIFYKKLKKIIKIIYLINSCDIIYIYIW